MKKKLKRFFAVFLCVFVITNSVLTAKVQAVPIVVGGLVTVGVLLLAATAYVATKNGVDIPIPDNQKMVNFMADFIEEHQGAYDTVSGWWDNIKNSARSFNIANATLAASYVKGATDMFKFGVKDTDNVKVPINSDVEAVIKDAIKEYYGYPEISAGTATVDPVFKDISSIVEDCGYTYVNPNYDRALYPYVMVVKYDPIAYKPDLFFIASKKPFSVYVRDWGNYCVLFPWSEDKNVRVMRYWFNGNMRTYTEYDHVLQNTDTGYPLVWIDAYDGSYDQVKNINLIKQRVVYANADITIGTDIIPTVVNTDLPTYVIDATKYGVEPKDTAVISANSVLQKQLENIDNIANTDIVVKAIDNANKIAERTGSNVIDVVISGIDVADDAKWYDVALNSLKDFAKWLFIPSSAAVNEFVQEATNKVEGQSNIFTYPLELVIKFLMAVALLGKSDCILTLPRIEFKGHLLYAGTSFNFTDYVEQSQFSDLYRLYLYFIDFIMIIGMLNLATKKWDEIIRGN